MNTADVKDLQRSLNRFTDRYLKHVTPLRVDGDMGHATKKRIKAVKWYLGYGKGKRDASVDHEFRTRMRHPKRVRHSSPRAVERGARRRVRQRRRAKKSHKIAHTSSGVSTFDGKPCANWLIPYLQWARGNGWDGVLVSGWRDPAYSEQVCREMCGAPTCAGRCAGRTSNHVGSVKPRGALDVTFYDDFDRLMRSCPLEPRIFNALGDRDPVHFSASGR